jgi:hypothetical protein
MPAGTLHLNTDARTGEVRVEMLNDRGVILAESARLTGDRLKAPVAFSPKSLPVGECVRLRIIARNAKLYSYWVQ